MLKRLFFAFLILAMPFIAVASDRGSRANSGALRPEQLSVAQGVNQDPCAICTEVMKDNVYRLHGVHCYHTHCIKQWIDTARAKRWAVNCPHCRQNISPAQQTEINNAYALLHPWKARWEKGRPILRTLLNYGCFGLSMLSARASIQSFQVPNQSAEQNTLIKQALKLLAGGFAAFAVSNFLKS